MKQNTSSFSLNVLTTAKSTLIKTVLLSASVLALGSVSAYAEPKYEVVTKKIYHFAGFGDAVRVTGQQTDPTIYSTVAPVGTNWEEKGFNNPIVAYECTVSEQDKCDVKLGVEVKTTSEQQRVLSKFWEVERHVDSERFLPVPLTASGSVTSVRNNEFIDEKHKRCLAQADKLSGIQRQLQRLICDTEARERLLGGL